MEKCEKKIDEHLDGGVAAAVENSTGLERLDGRHGDGDVNGKRKREIATHTRMASVCEEMVE